MPYTLHMNDIASYTFEGWNPAAYEQALRDEFDQLYEEGARRRRMMAIGLHDRISGHANRVRCSTASSPMPARSPVSGSPARMRSRPGRLSIATSRRSTIARRLLSPACPALRPNAEAKPEDQK